MTTITPSPILKAAATHRRRRGFTLVELMVSATLSAFVLAGILSTFLFLGRSGANLRNYSDMESQARKALEVFAQDVRQASAITWTASSSVTLVVNTVSITYTHSTANNTFTRVIGANSQTLITGIAGGSFTFKAFNVAGTEMPLSTAAERTAASSSTKQLQISLEASRSTTTVATATNLVLSARYVLRNKVVTA